VSVEIVLTDSPPASAREAIVRPLLAFNASQAGEPNARPLALLIHDESGAIIGGLWGRTTWNWLFVELLFIPETLRGSGLGAELMQRAEDEARSRGCARAWLDTFSFQARGFYEKLGYKVFGSLNDYPPGHQRHFLQKSLI
jgi:GNAT superfamily N-acetyltransferase